jgi:hypothetical protein
MAAIDRTERTATSQPVGRLAASRRRLGAGAPSGVAPLDGCRMTAQIAAGYYQVTPEAIAAPTRHSRRAARARHVAIYLAHVTLGLPLAAVAGAFRRDRSTVTYACRRIEDARDNPAFDRALADLELAAAIVQGLGEQGRAA